jgi:hypothetical protein
MRRQETSSGRLSLSTLVETQVMPWPSVALSANGEASDDVCDSVAHSTLNEWLLPDVVWRPDNAAIDAPNGYASLRPLSPESPREVQFRFTVEAPSVAKAASPREVSSVNDGSNGVSGDLSRVPACGYAWAAASPELELQVRP